jgi:hypothetical protein
VTGRPEFVGIIPDPEYRGKRLQQHIMDALHARAEEDGALVQVINGINWVRTKAARFDNQVRYDPACVVL